MDQMELALSELVAEQAEIDALLAGLTPEQWSAPTPAAGWDVRDQVSHLADTNEVAVDTMRGGPRALNEAVADFTSPEAFTLAGCERGRAQSPAEVLAWWRASSAAQLSAFRSMDPAARVPWGLGMTARTLVTARLMEHWAHALDVKTAVGAPVEVTPQLRSVAWLITKAVPYAFAMSQTALPDGRTLRVELDAPSATGATTWSIGPDAATDLIAGDALEFCRLGVQRCTREDTSLRADGPFADATLDRLRAFL